MKHSGLLVLTLAATIACTQRPSPVASDTAPVDPSERVAIAVEFVAVPKATVYARPATDAPVTGSYGMLEAISVLEKKGEWCMVRTFSGAGWVKQAELMSGDAAEKMDTLTPRFFVPPVEVPLAAKGELAFQAKVNSDGDVAEVKTILNTTGSLKVEEANAKALQAAKFYPMIDKGQRKTFVYEHHVYY